MTYTTKQVAEMVGVTSITAGTWAKNNGVKREVLAGKPILIYVWNEEDIERFKSRCVKRGRKRSNIIKVKERKTTIIKAADVLELMKKK